MPMLLNNRAATILHTPRMKNFRERSGRKVSIFEAVV